MENSKVWIAAIAGAAAGAVVALLLAPESGGELRNKIREGAKKLTDDLRSQIQDGIGAFGRTKEQASNEYADRTNV